jgi:hypothetical protein
VKFPVPLFPLGSIVYLRVNAERRGMVTGYMVRPGGLLLYLVSWDEPISEAEHWGCELSDTKTFGDGEGVGASTG